MTILNLNQSNAHFSHLGDSVELDDLSLVILSLLITVIMTTFLATLLTMLSPAKYVGENRRSIQYFQFMFLFLAISYVVLVFSEHLPEMVHQILNTVISCIAAGCFVSGFYTRFNIELGFYRNRIFWFLTIALSLFNGFKQDIIPMVDAFLPGATGLTHILMLLVYVICIINCIQLLIVNRKSEKTSSLTIAGMFLVLLVALYLMFVPLIFRSAEVQIAQTAMGIVLFLFIFGGVIGTMFMEDLVNLHRKQAITDVLTGLKNRRYFLEQSALQHQKASDNNSPLSILICDIDNFKAINDNFGHTVGDKVIAKFAKTLKQMVRSEDIVARFGGEEFVALLPGIDVEQAMKIAERLRQTVADELIETEEKDIYVTVSIGVADCTGTGVEKGLVNADRALYNAKDYGRNQVCLYQ